MDVCPSGSAPSDAEHYCAKWAACSVQDAKQYWTAHSNATGKHVQLRHTWASNLGAAGPWSADPVVCQAEYLYGPDFAKYCATKLPPSKYTERILLCIRRDLYVEFGFHIMWVMPVLFRRSIV